MNTKGWSDAKRTFYLHVQDLRYRRYELGRERNLLIRTYINAASLHDRAEQRLVRADIGKRLQSVGRELNAAEGRYRRANVTLRGMV